MNEIIRQLAVANTKAGEGNADSPTPISNGNKPPVVDENDAAGDNVYSLVPPPPASDTAAYRAPNRGKKQKDKQDEDAEGSQDPDDGSQDDD